MTTPSPRPAALVAAMKKAFLAAFSVHSPDQLGEQLEAALAAASRAGFVLIPRAELEEAADMLHYFQMVEPPRNLYEQIALENAKDMETKLRQRSRG